MKIKRILTAPGRTGFFFDDQRAIKKGAEPDGFTYKGECVTPGFSAIRQSGESISILLVLESGTIAHGDCAAVQYSGAGGRDPLFLAEEFTPIIDRVVKPRLEGLELTSFRALAEKLDRLSDPLTGRRLHTAIRYGVTQALLDAVAKAKGKLMVDIIAEEYDTVPQTRPVPIFAQTGDERYTNVDKMIIKKVDILPHGLINNIPEKLGKNGEKLLAYINWVKKRVEELKTINACARNDYNPVLHIDVYGTIGLIFNNDQEKIADYLGRLQEAAAPLSLRIEGPVDMEEKELQVEMLAELTELVHRRGIRVELVADEWCNTLDDIKLFTRKKAGDMVQIKTPDLGGINNIIEAVLYCKSQKVKAYLGGTCNETERSAQICTHIAMATGPDQILAKPGMGVDEGYMIVYNEMSRILAWHNMMS